MSRKVVVDASFVLEACMEVEGFSPIAGYTAIAPSLMWSEALSALHEGLYRKEISLELAALARERLWAVPVGARPLSDYAEAAWQLTEGLGWAKTYDAEYVALAQIADCPLVTIDHRLRRGAAHVVRIVGPTEL